MAIHGKSVQVRIGERTYEFEEIVAECDFLHVSAFEMKNESILLIDISNDVPETDKSVFSVQNRAADIQWIGKGQTTIAALKNVVCRNEAAKAFVWKHRASRSITVTGQVPE